MNKRKKIGNCINKSFKQIMEFQKIYLVISFGIKIFQGAMPAVSVVLLQKIIKCL